ncbi:Pro-kumamolisin, activation domain-containing protein [Lactarius hatsudake]|nr:Pro-kumamolisin, activation domain-containing protein [Lactarius hatsudake]
MHYYHCISVLSVLATGLLGGLVKPLSPPWDDMHVKHSWNTVPRNWESLGHPPSGTTIDLYIALKPQRENAVVDALYRLQVPPLRCRYRAYLTKEQVAELVAPRPETLELVNSWLEHHGISSSSISMTHSGNTLMFKGVSVTQANTLLGASYQLYRHVERGETIRRAGPGNSPHRHAFVGPYVTVVGGTTDYEPEVAADFSGSGSRAALSARRTRKRPCPPSSRTSGTTIKAFTSRRTPDLFQRHEQKETGTSIAAPVRLSLPFSYLRRPSLTAQLTANLRVVAGIISLLNDWLILTGREPLGFLNPFGRGFRGLDDITEGSNPGCGTDGFSAIVGWDPLPRSPLRHPLTRTAPHRIVQQAVHPDAHISTAKANGKYPVIVIDKLTAVSYSTTGTPSR